MTAPSRHRILVANRAEIARRVMRTAHRLGHETVAVYAEPDERAPFVAEATTAVAIGPADLAQSYLSIERILAAAATTGATAVHPGYGFLAENGSFARAVEAAGLVWIGPHPAAVDQMGSKIEARRLATGAGVPIIPGFDESQDVARLEAAAKAIGYPVLIKAAAGGGGKGIRIAESADAFSDRLEEASSEAQRAFGDGAVIVERYIQRPRHVEVQIIGDKHGAVVELGTRECSVQRRYQKLLEEAPAPNLPPTTERGLRSSAVALARSMAYDSAGTVEFIVDDATGDYYFLEMNTRLQVEHPVTEAVTGLDLVDLQIGSGLGRPLPIAQDDVAFAGHAFEARINAEDPASGFAPQIGTITHLRVPTDVRWDSGIELGSEISPHYDPMIAKLIVAGPDRATALRRLTAALDQLVVGGLVTNTGFHRWLVGQDSIVDGRVTTRFLDETAIPPGPDPTRSAANAATAWVSRRRVDRDPGPWGQLTGFRVTPHRPATTVFLEDANGVAHAVAPTSDTGSGPVSVDVEERSVAVSVDGHTATFRVLSRSEMWAPSADTGHGHAGAIVAPFPAVVTGVAADVGATVAGGDVVVVIEAMKMLHSLAAAGPGVVAEIRVGPGDQVATGQVLVTFESVEAAPADDPVATVE